MKNINVTLCEYLDTPHHFNILDDGTVRQHYKFNPEQEDTMTVLVPSFNGSITDKQCQSAVSLVLASKLTYQAPDVNVVCNGITWSELMRRG